MVRELEADAFFSDDYAEARDRFRSAAESTGARLESYPVDATQDLSIDVASLSPASAQDLLVVSSGVHGVEGPFGSAVQRQLLKLIEDEKWPHRVRLVLIHAVNPYGFVHGRRWNEDNVDLNRNFLSDESEYRGVADGYRSIESLLNPPSPPSRWEPFRIKAAFQIARHGMRSIKEAIAAGQYEYPRGLFFGGKQPSASARIFAEHYARWIGNASRIVHLDLHTGLGRFSEYRLLLESEAGSDQAIWFRRTFDPSVVECGSEGQTAYAARGTLGSWASARFTDRLFRFVTADFGTYSPVKVLAALRDENRAHHFGGGRKEYEWARHRLRECFCPQSTQWRRNVLQSGVAIVNTAAAALAAEAER